MKQTLTLIALMLLACFSPAEAQQVVIDGITVQTAASYIVNQDMVVRFDVYNHSGEPLAAEDYSLTVNVGGVYAGKPAETKAIAAGGSESFMATVAPHKAGEDLLVEVVFEGEETVRRTAVTTVTVALEVSQNVVQVGNCADARDVDGYSPLCTYNNYSQYEVVYTAQDLGLAAGDKIGSITYKGRREEESCVPLKVWVELTDDVTPASRGLTTFATEHATMVYDGNYTFPAGGTDAQKIPVFSLTFPQPIAYVEGKSLRVLIETNKADKSVRTYVECDKTKADQVAGRYIDSSMEELLGRKFTGTPYKLPYYLPVLYLDLANEPTVVAGTVTVQNRAGNVVPLANATVTLASGNVMYFATTDAEGKYSVEVLQDMLTYDVTVQGDGITLFPFTETVALGGASVIKDLCVQEGHGAYITAAQLPTTAAENYPVTIRAMINNYDATTMDVGNAQIVLKLDGEPVAEVSDLLIWGYANEHVTLTFTPHVYGTRELSLEVYVDNVLQHAVSSALAIAEERSYKEYAIGEGAVIASESTSPIRLYSSHSYSQTLLTADMLGGLAPGSQITGLRLESAQSSNTKDFNFELKVWMMNTGDGVENITTDSHNAALQQVYSATLVQRPHGSYNSGAVVYETFLDLVLDEPFVYEGQNIRIAMKADVEGNGYQQTYFKSLKDVKTSYTKSSDNPKIEGVAVDIMDYTWASSPSQTPIFTFVVENKTLVTGAVIDKETRAPVANAEVKLVSNDGTDILYTATTDAEGKFAVTILQTDHSYNTTIAAEGYETIEDAGTIGAEFSSPFDLGTIALQKATGISAISGPTSRDSCLMYNIAGQRVSRSARGIIIRSGRKVLVK